MKMTTIIAVGLIAYAIITTQQKPNIKVPPKPSGQNLNQANYTEWVTFAALILTQVKNIFGSIDAAKNFLWGPTGPFYKTPVPQYDAGSVFWQDVDNIA